MTFVDLKNPFFKQCFWYERPLKYLLTPNCIVRYVFKETIQNMGFGLPILVVKKSIKSTIWIATDEEGKKICIRGSKPEKCQKRKKTKKKILLHNLNFIQSHWNVFFENIFWGSFYSFFNPLRVVNVRGERSKLLIKLLFSRGLLWGYTPDCQWGRSFADFGRSAVDQVCHSNWF